jgi:hypothetical protein
MKYVFDSGPFIDSRNYFPTVFKKYWNALNGLADQREIISVKEVYNELINVSDIISDWVKINDSIFETPTQDEFLVVKDILSRHKELIRNANYSGGSPVADPFIIAKAYVNKLIVVTQEVFREHAHKVPNICKEFRIQHFTLEDFMLNEGWEF